MICQKFLFAVKSLTKYTKSDTFIKTEILKEKDEMAITKKQKELDEIKWLKSEAQGADACGSFDYCAVCDKEKENPCDKAYKAFNKKTAVKKSGAKTAAKREAAATESK